MELRLQQLIDLFETSSNIRNLDTNNPIVMRISHPTNATTHVIACSIQEPYLLVLPVNVTWFVYNPQSAHYRKAFRRVTKSKDVSSDMNHTWESIDKYEQVFVEQYYDSVDSALLTDSSTPDPATTVKLGIARLSVEAELDSNPIVVEVSDPRLSDARYPKEHEHPQLPARQLRTSDGVVTIEGSSSPEAGQVLVATGPNTAEWRRLRTSDIN